jgi:hypothetical protein
MATAPLTLVDDPSPRPAQKHVVTTVTGLNADLLAEVTRLYRLDGLTVADVTYGEGGFWPKVDTSRFTLLGTDLYIDPALVAQGTLWATQAPTLFRADFRALPYAAASIDALFFDPPYMHNPGPHLEMNTRYRNHQTTQGMYHRDILRELYARGIQEAWRVLRPGGLLLCKGQDEIESSRQCWSHAEVRLAAERCGFTAQDQFFLVTRASVTQLKADHHRQYHARRNSSWLWVFIREQTGTLAKRGRPKKDSVRTTIKQGRGRDYLAARLVRDYPSIYARYQAGELATVYAAAREAGLVKARH